VRRALNITAVILALLVAVLAIGDRVGVHYAEKAIAERVALQLKERNVTSAPPEVTITGYPFLTQVLRGNYDEIDVDLRDVRTEKLPIPLLRVKAYDVRASVSDMMDGKGKVVASRIDGTATLSYQALVEAGKLKDITLSGDGTNLRISGNVPIAGLVSGAAEVTAVEGKVRIKVKELTAANAAPVAQRLINQLKDQLGAIVFSLPPMPFNLKLVKVHPGLGGLEISMTTTEVELAG
jgi:LmeA-like phospholipid-binding